MTRSEQALNNIQAIAMRRRSATHCSRGHEFNKDNTGWAKNGTRFCKICVKQMRRETNAFNLGQMTIDLNHHLHGTTNGYKTGCKCKKCTKANTDACALYRQRRNNKQQ